MRLKYLLIVSLLSLCVLSVKGQSFALRTSGVLWATLTPNVEMSYVINEHITAHLPLQYNPFVFGDNSRIQQLTCMPGARYWFKLAHARYFVSAYAIASRFHVGGWFDHDYRYDGQCFGVGVGGGYSWILNKYFNIEAELGVGTAYANYDKCYWPKNSKLYSHEKGIRVFPAKFDVSLVYFF